MWGAFVLHMGAFFSISLGGGRGLFLLIGRFLEIAPTYKNFRWPP